MKKTPDDFFINIAIIDDGVNENLYSTKINYNKEVTIDLDVVERADYDTYQPSHGTLCEERLIG